MHHFIDSILHEDDSGMPVMQDRITFLEMATPHDHGSIGIDTIVYNFVDSTWQKDDSGMRVM